MTEAVYQPRLAFSETREIDGALYEITSTRYTPGDNPKFLGATARCTQDCDNNKMFIEL